MVFSYGYNWLRAVGWSKYEKNLVEHGYDTYPSCVNLSKADLRAAGVDDSHVDFLAYSDRGAEGYL